MISPTTPPVKYIVDFSQYGVNFWNMVLVPLSLTLKDPPPFQQCREIFNEIMLQIFDAMDPTFEFYAKMLQGLPLYNRIPSGQLLSEIPGFQEAVHQLAIGTYFTLRAHNIFQLTEGRYILLDHPDPTYLVIYAPFE